jgi:hypothetical protein
MSIHIDNKCGDKFTVLNSCKKRRGCSTTHLILPYGNVPKCVPTGVFSKRHDTKKVLCVS